MNRNLGGAAPKAAGAGRSKVLIVSDQPVARLGIHVLVDGQGDLAVCGEADNGPAASALVPKLEPAVAIVDLSLGTMAGIELVRHLRGLRPPMRVLVLSTQDEDIYAERALRAGAAGYIMKQQPVDEILAAVRRVLSGELYLSDAIKEKMLHSLVKNRGDEFIFPIDSLTNREMEVFRLVGKGYRTRQIAARLHLSAKTIDSHREHLKRKLGIASGADLVRHAIEWAKGDRFS